MANPNTHENQDAPVATNEASAEGAADRPGMHLWLRRFYDTTESLPESFLADRGDAPPEARPDL